MAKLYLQKYEDNRFLLEFPSQTIAEEFLTLIGGVQRMPATDRFNPSREIPERNQEKPNKLYFPWYKALNGEITIVFASETMRTHFDQLLIKSITLNATDHTGQGCSMSIPNSNLQAFGVNNVLHFIPTQFYTTKIIAIDLPNNLVEQEMNDDIEYRADEIFPTGCTSKVIGVSAILKKNMSDPSLLSTKLNIRKRTLPVGVQLLKNMLMKE